jgi:hypothetical protein
VQPQNCEPACLPLRAVRRVMGLPHRGQAGEGSGVLAVAFRLRSAMRAAANCSE